MKIRRTMVTLGAAAMMSIGATGCGGDDASSASSSTAAGEANEPPATTTAVAPGGNTLEIKMDDYSFTPSAATAKAGKITIEAPNDGSLPHELVVAETGDDPANLPTASDGSVDEESLDSPGEVGETEAGASGSTTLDLKPGKYVMFCNIPGHYAAGMYGTLTVK